MSVGQLRFFPVRRFMLLIVGVYFMMDYGLLVSSGYVASRHMLVPVLFLLPYAVVGCIGLARVLRQTVFSQVCLPRKWGFQLVLVICFAGMIAGTSDRLFETRRDTRNPMRLIGLWIQSAGPPGPVIISNYRPRIALYADGKQIDLFRAFLDEKSGYVKNMKSQNVCFDGIMRFASFVHADYLVVTRSKILLFIPDFFEQVDGRVKLVYEVSSRGKRASDFLVYRIVGMSRGEKGARTAAMPD